MDIVISILGKIGECVIESIKFQFAYMSTYDDNIADLKHRLETLENMENDVNVAIDAANKNNEGIRKTVQQWMTNVERVKMEARKFLEEDVEVNRRRGRGWFPILKTRYSLSKEAVSKNETMKRLCEEAALFDHINVSLPAAPPGIESMASKDFVLFQTTKLAMEDAMAALRKDSINFVGIHGMGGVGKTTLVKEIGRKCKEEKLFDNVVMAVVSQTVKVESIQEQIADFLGLKLEEKTEMLRATRLRDRFKGEKKILVILDDVWNTLNPDTIGIPSGEDHKGCKIVITTRRRQVCTAMGRSVEATRIISLDVLNKQESWDLFKKQVGDIIDSPTVKIEAEKLVKECGGLPIALVTVGNAMRGKDLPEWKEAALELKKSRPTNVEGMEENVFKCIKFSYDYLRDEEAKACFLLCCLFPEDYNIQIERLVRYGVGLNTFKGIDKIQEARRRAHSIINNLKASSLLVASEREGCIKMHDVVRDVAKTISSGKYFVKDGEVLKEWPNELSMDEYNGIGISLMRNEIQNYPDAWECPNLELFLTRHYDVEQEMSEAVFKGMKKLRVLDQFHGRVEKRRFEPSLSHLTNLRTLFIEGYSIFSRMEVWGISALGELKMLQVVTFRECVFREGLDVLRKLKKLRLLELFSCRNCFSLFNYTRTLDEGCIFPQLEELHVTEAMSRSVAELINCHPRLHGLRFNIKDISQIPDNFVFPQLDHFVIVVAGPTRYNFEAFMKYDVFEGDYFENILYLRGKNRRLDMASLSKIGTLLPVVNILIIVRFLGFRNILPYFICCSDSLAILKKLEVWKCNELEFLINIEEESRTPRLTCFSCLEEVKLYELESFRGLCGMGLVDMPNSFVSLRELDIRSCPKMSNIGLSLNLLRRMRRLEVLEIHGCEAVEYLFDLEEVEDAVENDEEGILINLREMSIQYMDNLEQLWKGPIGLVHLGNLKTVYIVKCRKLRVLFHWPVAQRLEQLEKLRIRDCDELEEIVGRETGEEATGLEPFRCLNNVEISRCNKLKVVFHWSVAQRLEQLMQLDIAKCEELEEIVGKETREESVHKVLFPELQYLRMMELPKLVGFYTGILPGSQSTPKLKTFRMGMDNVEIAVDGKNLDTVIKEQKGLLL